MIDDKKHNPEEIDLEVIDTDEFGREEINKEAKKPSGNKTSGKRPSRKKASRKRTPRGKSSGDKNSGKKAGKGVLALRICIGILVFILAIILIATAVFYILRSKGKRSIYENVNNSAPVIPGLFDETQEPPAQGGNDKNASKTDDKTAEASAAVKETETSAESEPESTQSNQSQNPGYVYRAGDVSCNGRIYRYNSDIMTFLVMGIDSTSEIPTDTSNLDYIKGGQADANFLLVMNPHTKKIACIALNRNTMTDIDVYNSSNQYLRTIKAQLCLQHGFGDGKALSCERARQTVSEMLYNLPVHGYCSIRLTAIPEINDSLGGVEVTLSEDFAPLGFTAGSTVHLNGDQAYKFLQYRDKSVFDSATTRLNNEKLYLTAFMKAAWNKTKSDITYPLNLYNTLSGYVYTDLSADEITYLASELIGYSFDDLAMYSLPGQTVKGERFEEFYIDEAALKELMLQVFYEIVG